MKSINVIVAALMCSASAYSQSYADALRFNRNDIEGTARSQAMGGAFGALGADLTSISINPAGLGSYRSTEFSFSLGVNTNMTKTDYYGYLNEDDKISVPLNHMGLNIHWTMDESTFAHNFAISYSQLANYNSNAIYNDQNEFNSLLDNMTDDYMIDFYGLNYYGGMAYDAGYIIDDKTNRTAYNIWEIPYVSQASVSKGDTVVRIERDEFGDFGPIDHYRHVKERGTKGELVFAYGVNIANNLQIGAALGCDIIDYREKMLHNEQYYGGDENYQYSKDFDYGTELKQDGSGVNFKIGVIYKPINELRIGFALHTPTAYTIKDRYYAYMTNEYNNHYQNYDSEYEYHFRSPGRFVASVAGVIGNFGIVSFDYDRSNWGRSKFRETDYDIDDFSDVNEDMKLAMKSVETFRFGVEGRVTDFCSVRAGYRRSSSPLKDKAWINCDHATTSYSCGIGLNFNFFYLDASFVQTRTDKDYWVLPDSDNYYVPNEPARCDIKANNVTITAGFKF